MNTLLMCKPWKLWVGYSKLSTRGPAVLRPVWRLGIQAELDEDSWVSMYFLETSADMGEGFWEEMKC